MFGKKQQQIDNLEAELANYKLKVDKHRNWAVNAQAKVEAILYDLGKLVEDATKLKKAELVDGIKAIHDMRS